MRRGLELMVLAGFIAWAGCASSGGGAADQTAAMPPGANEPMAMHEHHAMADLPATAGADYTVADVRFMQHMIGHHFQAVDMAKMAPTREASERLLKLTEKIDISQTDEIRFMREWLAAREQAVPTDAQARAMMMPGMLTPEQMAQLAAARGREFDRLFLTHMIMHHEGALLMVEELLDAPMAAQEPEIFRFVTDVDADQRDEIFAMENMLAELDTIRGSRSR